MARINATITAFTVEVSCPHCGGSLPAPCGSMFWELREVVEAAVADGGKVDCPECDEPIRIVMHSRVTAEYSPPNVVEMLGAKAAP